MYEPVGIDDNSLFPPRAMTALDARYVGTTLGDTLSSRVLYGTGSPEGVVTASIGTTYVDTAATTGAVKWLKTTAVPGSPTANGWVVEYGKTGLLNIATLASNGWTVGILRLTRMGSRVILTAYNLNPAAATADTLLTFPAGFRATAHGGGDLQLPFRSGASGVIYGLLSASLNTLVLSRASGMVAPTAVTQVTWNTADAWPPTLPGVLI